MPPPHRPGHRDAASRLEALITRELERVPGVLAATVWLNDTAMVREIRLTGAPGTSTYLLEGAATTILQGHGLEFSTDQLRVEALDTDIAPTPPWRGRFLVLDDIEIQRADQQVDCEVRIMRRGEPSTGAGRDIDSELGRARAAAIATMRAAEYATSGVALGLEGLQIPEYFGRRYVVLSIEVAVARRRSHLPGIAQIVQSAETASALATLSAIERWLAW